MIYCACGPDLSKKLTGKNIHNYNLWAHLIWKKLKVDKILFLTNSDKTDYVFSQMEVLIWNKINTWVIIQRDSLTVDKIFAEVENYMNITQHKANAKKKLTMIAMRQDKMVSEFYHRIFDLWTIAGMQSENQIEIFQALLSPWICNQLSTKWYTDFNTLLHNTRLVEEMRKENAICFPCQNSQCTIRVVALVAWPLQAQIQVKMHVAMALPIVFLADKDSIAIQWLQGLLDGLDNGTNHKQTLQNWQILTAKCCQSKDPAGVVVD